MTNIIFKSSLSASLRKVWIKMPEDTIMIVDVAFGIAAESMDKV